MSRPTTRRRSKAPPFAVGDKVIAEAGAFRGADPFTVYVVTAVHHDGSLDLVPTAGDTIERVRPRGLMAA